MKRTAGISLFCLILLAAPVGAQTSTTIVAGQSAAGVRIGGNVDDAITVLGNLVDRTDAQSGKYTIFDWPLRPLFLIAEKESGRVVMVVVAFTDAYRTDRGITGGSEQQAVENAYGREFTTTERQTAIRMVYDALGIAFDIGKTGAMSGRVLQIFVFVPGQWKQLTESS